MTLNGRIVGRQFTLNGTDAIVKEKISMHRPYQNDMDSTPVVSDLILASFRQAYIIPAHEK